jgi:hypothetical protein
MKTLQDLQEILTLKMGSAFAGIIENRYGVPILIWDENELYIEGENYYHGDAQTYPDYERFGADELDELIEAIVGEE